MKIDTIRFARATQVAFVLGLSDDEQDYLFNYECDHWSFGDTMFTCVGNIQFLEAVQRAVDTGDHPRDISEKYWEIVPEDVYINLEG